MFDLDSGAAFADKVCPGKVIIGIFVIGIVGLVTDKIFGIALNKLFKGNGENGWN